MALDRAMVAPSTLSIVSTWGCGCWRKTRGPAFAQAVVLAAIEGQPHLVGADLVLEADGQGGNPGGGEDPVVRRRIDRDSG